ncbi:MAG TPA: D-alanyl-D-alanine carboxypeptidase family protein [Gammaproteobacteria bacterium]|nr:D-alanyl-D-alanine carboxypeptidase family protein [Gammaproteobacteria bacterium]
MLQPRLLVFSLLCLCFSQPLFAADAPAKSPPTTAQTEAQTAAQPIPAPPSVAARAYALMDFHSGDILAQNNADQRMEPASLTKLMTAYAVFKELATGKIKLTDQASISEKAWRTEGSRTFVKVNTKVGLEDLLKGMIVQSGNDATLALAEHAAGSEESFVALMNQHAKEIGMEHSHFTNSTGLPDPELYVTAADMAKLARALIRDFPEYYKWYSVKEFTYNGITQYNRNKLLWRDIGVDGVKTGHTDAAGYCLIASAKHDDMRLISVVLGTESENSRAKESEQLLNYGFRFYETHALYAAGKPLGTARVWKGVSRDLPLGLSEDLYVTVPRGQYKNLTAALEVDMRIIAPASKGERHGAVKVSLGDKVLATRPLVALQDVAQGGWWRRLVDTVKLWFAK